MLVTLRKPDGETETLSEESAKLRIQLGYYQYNFKDDVYEYTQKMIDEIDMAVLKIQAAERSK